MLKTNWDSNNKMHQLLSAIVIIQIKLMLANLNQIFLKIT